MQWTVKHYTIKSSFATNATPNKKQKEKTRKTTIDIHSFVVAIRWKWLTTRSLNREHLSSFTYQYIKSSQIWNSKSLCQRALQIKNRLNRVGLTVTLNESANYSQYALHFFVFLVKLVDLLVTVVYSSRKILSWISFALIDDGRYQEWYRHGEMEGVPDF